MGQSTEKKDGTHKRGYRTGLSRMQFAESELPCLRSKEEWVWERKDRSLTRTVYRLIPPKNNVAKTLNKV